VYFAFANFANNCSIASVQLAITNELTIDDEPEPERAVPAAVMDVSAALYMRAEGGQLLTELSTRISRVKSVNVHELTI